MTLAEEAALYNLERVGKRPPLREYLADVWRRRDLTISMAKYRIQASNEENRLGMLWVVLKPTMNALIYGVVFGLLQGDRRPENIVAYIVIGVFLFEFFANAFSQGADSIMRNRALVQTLAFPRMALPLAAVIQQLMNLVPILVVMAAIVLFSGNPITWRWLLIIPLVVLLAMFSTGVALISARLTVHLTDIKEIIPIVTRVLFYTSGVFFSVERILGQFPWLVAIFDFYPLYEFLKLARSAMLPDYAADPVLWPLACGWSVLVLVCGVLFFWQAEERYGRIN
ncbi:ABC transporter permease [Arthrobacter mobilis]|uniref:Transport permease protein n=1 Tax=Arthrobacter mobilis TaxID=2724944 RepID=A0A7X6K7B3_9MICC|nr:ABC transporter permease [Arthrobacter mobilis]NKX56483.1 ABC transporter permease [Arthrobacter mobilis]